MQRREFLKRGLGITAAAAISKISLADNIQKPVVQPPNNRQSQPLPNLNELTGHVVLRGAPDYEDARLGRNTNTTTFPAAIVFCRRTQDVVHAVKWARKYDSPLRVRCGRHSYEGYSSVNDGIVIDVHDLRTVHYNPNGGTLKVGSGMSLAKVYEVLWPHRRTIPGGSCPTVGISGHALGGGYGLLARHLGMACDSILEVELVTADGRIIHANAHEHQDLLWASRGGGGGNFGVVTSFVFKTHPVNTVSIFHITWKWNDLETVINAWQSWASTTDDRLTSVLVLKSESNGTLSALGQFVGPADEMKRLVAPLTTAGTPVDISLEEMSFMDAVQTFSGQKPGREHWQLHWTGENAHFKHSSDYANTILDSAALAVIRHALETAPGEACYIQMEAYGGAINHTAPNATAFVHRQGTLCNLQYQAYWGHSQDGAPYVLD